MTISFTYSVFANDTRREDDNVEFGSGYEQSFAFQWEWSSYQKLFGCMIVFVSLVVHENIIIFRFDFESIFVGWRIIWFDRE